MAPRSSRNKRGGDRSAPAHHRDRLGVRFVVGIAAGVLPARRAARLDPAEALAAE